MLVDLIQHIVQLQAGGYCEQSGQCWVSCADQGGICPASAFTAIGAAFSTQGYWVQSDIIDYLTLTGMGLWAPLLYIIAAFGGLVSLAMGAPPRMYMWFFMGPAVYSWLLESRQPVNGVEWAVANRRQNQDEVWKLAEPGLINTGIVQRLGIHITTDSPPGIGGTTNQYADVAIPFLWFDELISDTVQQMTGWFGVFEQYDNPVGPGETNLSEEPVVANQSAQATPQWYLLSNAKWEMLWNITSARLHSGELRDAFVTFLSTECGDRLKRSIDAPSLIAISNAKGQNLDSNSTVLDQAHDGEYLLLSTNLEKQTIPMPPAIPELFKEWSDGSFSRFTNYYTNDPQFLNMMDSGEIKCSHYLELLIHGFRWETGHIMNQLVGAAPGNILPVNVVYNMLYGWDVVKDGYRLSPSDQIQYIENLILIHLFRNELAIAPKLVDMRYANSQLAMGYTTSYQRAVGSASKFAEVYTWAKMIPYLQGVLLYLLAIAYPFACLVIVIPGMHKSIFTWMSFWAWVKMWDLGFAIVMVLERSIWAMLGNNSNASKLNELVVEMSKWGAVLIKCDGQGEIPSGSNDGRSCSVPLIRSLVGYASSATGPGGPYGEGEMLAWKPLVQIFDRALVLGANLDFDLANSYYIYIMSALYFAVPTVTGQLVLGARAGAAGMVNTAIGGASQEIGKMAGSGAGSAVVTAMHANMASGSQAAFGKSLRQSNLGAAAIEAGNKSMGEEMNAAALGTANQNAQLKSSNFANTRQGLESNVDAGVRATAAGLNIANGLGSGGGNGGGPTIPLAAIPGSGGDLGGLPGHGADATQNQGTSAPGLPSSSPGRPVAATTGGGSAAAAAAGAARGGGGGGGGAQLVGGSGGILGTATSLANKSADAAISVGKNAAAQVALGQASAINAASAGFNTGSFAHGQAAKGYGAESSRASGHANFQAEQDAWKFRNDMANQMTGQAVAMGHFVGGMSAGNKPQGTMEGMARAGFLGSGAKAASNYTQEGQSGGFFAQKDARVAGINASGFGEQGVRQAYSASSLGEGMVHTGQAALAVPEGMLSSGRTLSQQMADTNGNRNALNGPGDAGRSAPVAYAATESIGGGAASGSDRRAPVGDASAVLGNK